MAGQTLSDIRTLLAHAGKRPVHRFGQNFLIDLNLMRKLTTSADLCPADVVLEVGPGTGSLTEMLLESGCRVVACEIDAGLQTILQQRLSSQPRFTLVCGDALDSKHAINAQLLSTLRATPPAPDGALKLVANLPYQIATPLILELLCGAASCERLCVTIQKELGERLAAPAGGAHYGGASVVLQSLAHVETIAAAPPTAFWPRPDVDSVMLRIRPLAEGALPVADRPAFARMVQGFFSQRRKMLRAIARRMGEPVISALAATRLDPDARPESLAPDAFQRLYAALRPDAPPDP